VFLFGIEIPRLVYKKTILKIFLSYMTFQLAKIAQPLIRVGKNFFETACIGYKKNRNFALISKRCPKFCYG